MPNFSLFGLKFGSTDTFTTSTYIEDDMTFLNEYPVYTKTQTVFMSASTYTNDHVTIVNVNPVFSQTSYPPYFLKTDNDGGLVLENWAGGQSWSASINSEGETIVNSSHDIDTYSWSEEFDVWSTLEHYTSIADTNHLGKYHHTETHQVIDEDDDKNFFDDTWPFKREEEDEEAILTTSLKISTSFDYSSSSGSAFSLYAQRTGLSFDERDYYETSQAASEESAAASAANMAYINGQSITMPTWAIAITVIGTIGFLVLAGGLVWLIARKRRTKNNVRIEQYYYPEQNKVENPFQSSTIIDQYPDVSLGSDNSVSCPPAYNQIQGYSKEKHMS